MTSLTRRALLTTAVASAAAGVGGALWLSSQDPYRPARPLPAGRFSSAVLGVHRFGRLRLDLTDGWRVTDAAGRVLWWVGGSPIAAARHHVTWRDHVGHQTFTEDRRSYPHWELREVQRHGATLTCRGPLGPWAAELQLTDSDPSLRVDLVVRGADTVTIRTAVARHEELHGLGAQSLPDLRGHVIPVISREQGVGRGRQPLTTLAERTRGAGGSATSTYTAIGRAVTGERTIELFGHAVSIWDARSGLDITHWSDRTRLTITPGTAPVPVGANDVEWNLPGAIISAQGGREVVTGKLRRLTDEGAEVSALWMQDWPGRRSTGFGDRVWWLWQVDEERYPDLPGWSTSLRRRGIQTFLYTNPFVVDAAERSDWSGRNLFAEAADHGHLVTRADGRPYLADQDGFDAGLIDLSNPAAGQWFHDQLRAEYDRLGATGGMADFAEGPPFDAHVAAGPVAAVHNAWPLLWARYQPGGWAFHRSASGPGELGHERPMMMWAGDQLTTWDAHDGMASAIAIILNAGVSGQPLMHSDVGGYTGLRQPVVAVRRDRELLLRWAEWSVFSPVLRTHEGNQPDRFAQVWDDDVVGEFALLTRRFAALARYRGKIIDQALVSGLPAMRPIWFDHPGTRAATIAGRTGSYRFGAFFVTPVLTPGTDSIRTVLPPGSWRHVWSQRTYAGDRLVEVDAPLGRPAVFHPVGDDEARDAADALVAVR